MPTKKITLMDFYKDETLLEKKKKKRKKKLPGLRKGSGGLDAGWYADGAPSGSSGTAAAPAVGESLISEIFAGILPGAFSANIDATSQYSKGYGRPKKDPGMTTYPSENPGAEEVEMKANKVDQARQLFQSMYNQPNATRAEIINAFMKDVGVTNSTAVSYYTRFLEEFGLNTKDNKEALGQGTGMAGGMGNAPTQQSGAGNEPPTVPEEPVKMEEPVDPNRAGITRTVDHAHLVYKRQSEDGTYDELWIYNIHRDTNDEMDIRRDILAGTDIPAKKTQSLDGKEKYIITTMGNAQMIKITGLPN